MEEREKKQYIGEILLKQGFKVWFMYMFRVINGRPFIYEPIHDDMFRLFEDIHNRKTIRNVLNIPPRSGKTTLAEFFIVYSYTINPKCNFIYTSYSQNLLSDIAQAIINIFEHPIYKAMYPQHNIEVEEHKLEAIDEFWRDYFIKKDKEEKKNTYTNKKIVTYAGGICWFASMGSQITGVGAGVRGSKQFSGGVILDDADKPSDIHSPVMREKSHKYYTETLLTRLNDSNGFILNIQQRLHIDDMSGFLISQYDFKALKKPLFDDDGNCLLKTQYSESRIDELKKDNYAFLSQYQQEPIPETGLLIDITKFNRYTTPPQSFDGLYICCDTAFSEKKSADNTAFMLMGIKGSSRYVLDLYCKKVNFVDLRKDLKAFYQKALVNYGKTTNLSSIYIEAKASGISLIQQLRSEGLPIQEIYPTVHNTELKKDEVKDKYTRYLEIEADIESGYVWIPESAYWLDGFLSECLRFTGRNQSAHDDMADVLIYCLKVARKYNIEDWSAFARAFGV